MRGGGVQPKPGIFKMARLHEDISAWKGYGRYHPHVVYLENQWTMLEAVGERCVGKGMFASARKIQSSGLVEQSYSVTESCNPPCQQLHRIFILKKLILFGTNWVQTLKVFVYSLSLNRKSQLSVLPPPLLFQRREIFSMCRCWPHASFWVTASVFPWYFWHLCSEKTGMEETPHLPQHSGSLIMGNCSKAVSHWLGLLGDCPPATSFTMPSLFTGTLWSAGTSQ